MRKFLKYLPNTLTSLNLFFGCVAIINIFTSDLEIAFWCIILSAVFDFFDGFAARLFNAHSPIGKDLDSLADMVSFGVAPAMVIYQLGGFYGLLIAVFSALRLAKFNIDTRQTTSFIGMPTPACSLFFMSMGAITNYYPESFLTSAFSSHAVLVGLTALFCYFLVSPIPMFSFKMKSYDFGSNKTVYVFWGVSVLSLVIFNLKAIPFIVFGYALISVTTYFLSKYGVCKQSCDKA